MSRRAALFALVPAALLVWAIAPVIAGRETFYLRDVLNYHLAVKETQAQAMLDGFLPLIDPYRAGGQALVGNLNNVALYPDNLLYLVAPARWALNAHLWIHLLLAPLAVYWLARAWGLEREPAWIAGFCYALSGFFLSQLNLYNLVAGAALAPAFAAACLHAVGPRPRPGLVGVGVLWALVLTSGDPIFAALILVLGGSAVLVRVGVRRSALWPLGVALACGTLLALPQLVELWRIFGSSYRGGLGFSPRTRLTGSWDPRLIAELAIPFVYGPPDMRYWGGTMLRGGRPLFLSLYPGAIAVALVLASGRPRSPRAVWAWSMILGGGFLALGGWNPALYYLYRLPIADALRFPIKAWLLVAVGASLLAGVGFERAFVREAKAAVLVALGILGAVAAALWLGLALRGGQAVAALRAHLVPAFPASLAAEEVARWSGALLVSLSVIAAAAALVLLARRAPRLAGSALLAAHVASQIVLLQPLLDADDVDFYSTRPPALASIAPGERVAQGCIVSLACDLGRLGRYPDSSLAWLERRAWLELYPFAGVRHDVRYAFNTSPDGLDTLLAVAGNRALRTLDDAPAMKLLAASAVDVVLTHREVDEAARGLVSLRARLPTIAGELLVYAIAGPAEEVRLARAVHGGDIRRALIEILRPEFDPRHDVFIPGRPEGVVVTSGGTATLREEEWERVAIDTRSESETVLVLARAYLPLYRASVDGRRVETLQANMGQLAIPVGAGAHRVEVWVDRRPFRYALGGTVAGALGLIVLALAPRRRAPAAAPG